MLFEPFCSVDTVISLGLLFYCIVSVLINKIFIHSFIPSFIHSLHSHLLVADAARLVPGLYVTVGCPSVRLSVCLSRRSTAAATCGWFAAERGRVQQINQYRSITAGARAAAASSVMLRSEAQRLVSYLHVSRYLQILLLLIGITHVNATFGQSSGTRRAPHSQIE